MSTVQLLSDLKSKDGVVKTNDYSPLIRSHNNNNKFVSYRIPTRDTYSYRQHRHRDQRKYFDYKDYRNKTNYKYRYNKEEYGTRREGNRYDENKINGKDDLVRSRNYGQKRDVQPVLEDKANRREVKRHDDKKISAKADCFRSKDCDDQLSNKDWSEHISSSGRLFYFNCITLESQWNKPVAWDQKPSKSQSEDNLKPNQSGNAIVLELLKDENATTSVVKPNMDNDCFNKNETDTQEAIEDIDRTVTDMDISDASNISESSLRSYSSSCKSEIFENIPTVTQKDIENNKIKIYNSFFEKSEYFEPGTDIKEAIKRNRNEMNAEEPILEKAEPKYEFRQLGTSLPKMKVMTFGNYPSSEANTISSSLLSPFFTKYYRSDLIRHVEDWPATLLEKEADKLKEDGHRFELQYSVANSQLKCCRGLVRDKSVLILTKECKLIHLKDSIVNRQNSIDAEITVLDNLLHEEIKTV